MMKKYLKKGLAALLAVTLTLGGFSTLNSGSALAAENETENIVTNGNGGKTDVGAWYTTYNTAAFWGENGRFSDPKTSPIGYKALLSDGSYGIPDSGSTAEIDFQLSKMAEAGIDFIVFDLTNGGLTDQFNYGIDSGLSFILNNAKMTCERIALWNATHRWQIRYAVGVGVYATLRETYTGEGTADIGLAAELQAQAVYETFVSNEVYGKYYYTVNEKPLLVLHETGNPYPETEWNNYAATAGNTTEYGSRFTVRGSNSRARAGAYGWYTYGSTSDDNACGAVADTEVMLVCPGQCNHANGNTTPSAYREDGAHYSQNWEAALEAVPRIVMISSLNDYMEDTAIWPTDTSECTVEEHWTTDGAEDPDKYWDITVDYITRLRTKNGDALKDAVMRTSENLVLGMTPSTPNYTKNGISALTDGNHAYGASQGYVLYGAGATNTNAANETYYQFAFDSARMLNRIKLYLSTEETKIRPRDIAVDVRLSDGSWVRTAARYDIDYVYDNITVAKDGVVLNSRLEFTFPAIECTAFRVTSNRQRTRVANNALTAVYNWRLTEIEAYYDTSITDYTGIGDPDNTAYVINALSDDVPTRNRTVTTDSTYAGTKGLDLITNNVRSGDGSGILIYYNTNSNTVYLDIEFAHPAPINRVELYHFYEWSGSYLKRSFRDVAIDALTPDGEYVRVAEKHNIDYTRTSNGYGQLYYYFPAMLATGIRVTYNKVQDGDYLYSKLLPLITPNEIQADYATTVTSEMYTGIEEATVAGAEITLCCSKNFALGATVSSSNTEAYHAEKTPVSNLTDGKNTRDSAQSIINYMANGIAWYRVDFDKKCRVNNVKLYLSMYEPDKLPQDIGVDILVGENWLRVAELHNISYAKNGDGTLANSDRILNFTFAPAQCSAVRLVASKQRNATAIFRTVELECYLDPGISEYTGVALPDEIAYIAAALGDVNNDLTADSADLLLMRKVLLGEKSVYRCDANYDGELDVRDLVCVKKAM